MEASGSEGTDGGGGDAAKGLADEWGHFLPLGEVIGIVTTQPCRWACCECRGVVVVDK